MATKGKGSRQTQTTAGNLRQWYKRFFIAASVALNIAFVVLFLSLATSYALDGLFIEDGLERYCSPENDDKFKNSAADVKAMREYICNAPEAFDKGYFEYLDSKGIPRPAN